MSNSIINQTQAVVLAAGKGVRMNSALPKVLHKVCGQSLILRALSCLKKAGVENSLVVVGSGKEEVEAEIKSFDSKVKTVHQTEQNGTGHAVKVCLDKLNKDFILILPGDVPLLKPEVFLSAFSEFEKSKSDVLVLSFSTNYPSGFWQNSKR